MALYPKIIYFLILLLPVQLGYHFWPDWALVLGRRIDYLSPTLYLTDLLIFLFILLAVAYSLPKIASFVKNLNAGRLKELFLKKKHWLLAILFALINIWLSQNRFVALYKWIKVAEFFFLASGIVKASLQTRRVNFFIAVAVGYTSLIAIGQFIAQSSLGGWLWFLGERTFTPATPGIARADFCFPAAAAGGSCYEWLRSYATFPHPNVLAGFLTMSLPIILYEALTNRKQIRIYFLLAFVLSVAALFFTFARSAWLASLILCTVVVKSIFKKKASKSKNVIFLIPLLALLLLFVLGFNYFFLLTKQSESFIVRRELLGASVNIWLRSPVAGAGLGNFLVQLPGELFSKTIYFLQPVHNIYFLALAETGIIGLLLFFWMLRKALLKRQAGLKTNVQDVYRYCLLAMLVLGMFDHYLLTLQQGQLILVILLALNIKFQNRNKPPQGES